MSLSLPQQTGASGAPVAECAQFLDGFTWGPVQAADVKLAGEQASAVPIQVIGASGFRRFPPTAPAPAPPRTRSPAWAPTASWASACSGRIAGSACAFVGSANPGLYYECPSLGCQTTAEPLTKQVQNPVWLFPTDNNGVVIQLPAVPIGGACR